MPRPPSDRTPTNKSRGLYLTDAEEAEVRQLADDLLRLGRIESATRSALFRYLVAEERKRLAANPRKIRKKSGEGA